MSPLQTDGPQVKVSNKAVAELAFAPVQSLLSPAFSTWGRLQAPSRAGCRSLWALPTIAFGLAVPQLAFLCTQPVIPAFQD